MVINTTFNNISMISWQSVLLEAETRVPGKNPPAGMEIVAFHKQRHTIVLIRSNLIKIRFPHLLPIFYRCFVVGTSTTDRK